MYRGMIWVMTRRTIKKTVYASGAALAFLGFLSLLIIAFGGVPTPTIQPSPTPNAYQPIQLEQVTVIPHPFVPGQKRYVDVVAAVRNPNAAAGISAYPVSFSIKDSGGVELATAQEETFILPGARQYAMALSIEIPISARVAGVDVTLPENPTFTAVPTDLDLPRFNTNLRQIQEQKIGDNTIQKQTGIVSNSSTFDWERVEVKAVGMNTNGDIVAAGKTFVGRLLVGEQREFTIEWPKSDQAIQRVITLPGTNMFRQDNIVDIIGDPSLLR